jgi:uncharacterized protein YlxW (UPF0749 family)
MPEGGLDMRATGLVVLLAASIAVATLIGCTEKEDTTAQTVRKKAAETVEAAKVFTLEQQQAYLESAKAKLKEYDQRIDDLQAQAEGVSDDARVALDRNIERLKQERDGAQAKLDKMGNATGEAWMQLKIGLDATMKNIEETYKTAQSEE